MEQQKEEQSQMKNSMLVQLLDQNARARLNTLKISKPEKAEMVEILSFFKARLETYDF